jgi:hypothetical protein
MGHALVQHLRWLGTVALAGCFGPGKEQHPPPPPPPRTTGYVSAEGRTGDGSAAAPFESIDRALAGGFERIVLKPGAYAVERVDIKRSVRLEGEGTVVIRGHVSVDAPDVTLRNLSMDGGLSSHFVERLRVENATVAPGAREDAASITRGSASFERVRFRCGPGTCLQSTSSTVTVDTTTAEAEAETQRVFRFDKSRAEVRRASIRGGASNQLQAGPSTRLTVEACELTGGSNGIVAVAGATLIAKEVVVAGASKTSLVIQASTAEIERGRYEGTPSMTIGISGSDVVLRDVDIGGSSFAAVSVSSHAKRRSRVTFDGGQIRHGPSSAILVSPSEVIVRGTKFVGLANAKEEHDAIVANGLDAHVIVESATFESPPGFAVGFFADAGGTVTATVIRPLSGGVTIQDTGADPIAIRGTVVEGCGGAGIDVQASTDVTIERVRVKGCEQGLLAGDRAKVGVARSRFLDSRLRGVAAFGGASVSLEDTVVSGSRVATFASCGDGARIEHRANNELTGLRSQCP